MGSASKKGTGAWQGGDSDPAKGMFGREEPKGNAPKNTKKWSVDTSRARKVNGLEWVPIIVEGKETNEWVPLGMVKEDSNWMSTRVPEKDIEANSNGYMKEKYGEKEPEAPASGEPLSALEYDTDTTKKRKKY